MSNSFSHKKIFRALLVPFVLLLLTALYAVLWRVLNLPHGDELIALVTTFFYIYGLWMVLVCSILESALLIGNYFPGGIVIFLSVIAAGHSTSQVVTTIAVVSVGFFIGYSVDYFLGKYGWYKAFVKFGLQNQIMRAEKKVSRHSLTAFLGSYWEPNLASITATAAGAVRMPGQKFFSQSAVAILVWNTFWGILVSILGEEIVLLFSKWEYLLYTIIVWVLVVLITELHSGRKNKA